MAAFEVGDRVRIDIPDEQDPDFEQYHDRVGKIKEIMPDDAGDSTGDERDSYIFRVQVDDDQKADFRWRDLRPIAE